MHSTLIIIETQRQFGVLGRRLQQESASIIPVFTSTVTHPAMTTVAILVVKFHTSDDHSLYVIPCYHADSEINMFAWAASLRTTQPIWTLDKKKLLHVLPDLSPHVIDLLGVEYIATGSIRPVPSLDSEMRLFTYTLTSPVRGEYMPLMRLVAYAERLLEHVDGIMRQHHQWATTTGFAFHNDVVIPTLYRMESSGIHIHRPEFSAHFSPHLCETIVHNDTVYTEYHPYTTTGRITGRFGGFNSSAINKTDGSRKAFTSRYGADGKLVLIDYESFHLRLIAELLDYTFPTDEPIHTQLAKQYYNTTTITPEQYDAGKVKTFQMLYDDSQDVSHIPFFKAIRAFVEQKAYEFARDGSVDTSTGRKIWKAVVDDPSPKKLFNYYLQVTEMEVSMQGLHDLLLATGHLRANPTIYTYDSIVLDCLIEDIPAVTTAAFDIMERSGRYPIRIWVGTDYHTMRNVTNTAKSHSQKKLRYLSS